jgi:hypothetical protein
MQILHAVAGGYGEEEEKRQGEGLPGQKSCW